MSTDLTNNPIETSEPDNSDLNNPDRLALVDLDEKTARVLEDVKQRLDRYLQKNKHQKNKFIDRAEIAQIESLQTKLKNYVFEIAAFGLSSCGKTAVLNALQVKSAQTKKQSEQIKNGKTGPLHGTTTELSYAVWDDSDSDVDSLKSPSKIQIKPIDTPGLDEVGGELRAEIAFVAANQADLILFVTAGDLTRLELEAIAQLQNLCKPILLICNKVDLYPESDRQRIHRALQDPELQALISTDEIIFTSAAPLLRRVRLEYADLTQEIWESPAIEITALRQKILDLLNQDGKALLAINIMRSLWEIQKKVIRRRLDRLPQRTFASGIFIVKAIAMLLSPSSGLNFILSVGIDGGAIVSSFLWGSVNLGVGMGLSVSLIVNLIAINAIILANIPNHYAQIGWIAVSTPWLIDWIYQDLQKPHAVNRLIKDLRAIGSKNSIVHKLNFH